MLPRPPRCTLTDTLFPSPTLFRLRRAVDLPLRAQNAQSVDPRQHIDMARHRMIFRPLEIVEQEDAVGLAVDDPLQQARDAETPGEDRKRTRLNSSHQCASRMPYSV